MANDSRWMWGIIIPVLVFALGTVFGRLVTPLLFRNDYVVEIHGSKAEGCHGGAGFASFRFGWYGGTGDGSYAMECNERSQDSYNMELHCVCDE